jgi:hypothetical protein
MIRINALPMLAYKVGPNLFDLSSQMHNVSMRDQMHRAVALAEALVEGKQFTQVNSSNQVLIVGAGVAGVSAGIVLARHGVEVLIIDSSPDAPFALQRKVTARYVGPYMYEWPLEVFTSQRLPPDPHTALAQWKTPYDPPLSFGAADPAQPATLVKDWDKQLVQAVQGSGGKLCVQRPGNSSQANAAIVRWLAAQRQALSNNATFAPHPVCMAGGSFWGPSAPLAGPFIPRFVLLAGGMGSETHALPDANGVKVKHGMPFWGNDHLLDAHCGKPSPPHVAIFGGGDGALQDTLRALTRHDHPLKTWDLLLSTDKLGLFAGCQQRILALEQQHAQVSVWERFDLQRVDANKKLDDAYRKLAKDLAQFPHVVDSVIDLLRDDVKSVLLCVREQHFSKAYALNRFLVHLFDQCVQVRGAYVTPVDFQVCWNMDLKQAVVNGAQTDLTFASGIALTADVVAVRFGADTSTLPGTWLGLTKTDTQNRRELAAVALPLFMPPTA